MEEQDEVTLDPGVTGPEAAAGESLLQRIKRRREESLEDETVTLDIPTWGGELKAKYGVVERAELEKMIKNIRKRQRLAGKVGAPDNADLLADVDFLIRACKAVVAYDQETDEQGDVTEGYNQELTDLLGIEASTARDLVIYLFKGNGIAIGAHAQKLAKWMQDTSRPVDDEDPQ